jgi:hypothetical protein
MRMQIITALPFIATALLGCGQAIDVGSNTAEGSGMPAGTARTLSNFSEFPDFSPTSITVVGDAVYVGGVSYPGREVTEPADKPGRLLKFPLNGAKPTEVWRGDNFRPPLKSFNNQIAFIETDPSNWRAPGYNYPGLHLYDTTTGRVTDLPNLPGRNYIYGFEFGFEGLVFSAGTTSDSTSGSRPFGTQTSVGQIRASELAPTELVNLTRKHPTFFRRSEHVLAHLAADDSESGLSEPESQALSVAVFAVDESGLRLEHRLERMPPQNPPYMQFEPIVATDESSYYLLSKFSNADGYSMRKLFRTTPSTQITREGMPVTYGWPIFENNCVYWQPFGRSMIRRATLSKIESAQTAGTEVAFDPRRQVRDMALGAHLIVWTSFSDVGGDMFRLMVTAIPQ